MSIYLTGLPRSGSTVLLNILKQNPALSDIKADRIWGTDKSLPELLKDSKPKVLVTYRPILEVLASFIRLAEQYPSTNFIDKLMVEEQFNAMFYRPTNDARCDWLMRSNSVIDYVSTTYKNVAIHKEWFHVITYDTLCENPQKVIKSIYNFLDIDYFEHDLKNIQQHDNSKDQEEYGIPTLHTIRSQIKKSSTNPEEVLSDYVIQKYSNAMDFFTKSWLQSQP